MTEPCATFKAWTTGPNNWHVHARHPVTGAWIRESGIYSKVAAWIKGDEFCGQLDAEFAEREQP